jgi:iron complex transport system substrate-binding protein
MTQSEIDDAVRKLASAGESLYEIDDLLLRELDPDLIVTQDLCHVCAITPKEVNRAIASLLRAPRVVTLNPRVLDDVFNDMMTLAREAGIDAMGVVSALHQRVKRIAPAAALSGKPTVACIEWLDPLWRTGHWVPGMVELAGGLEVLADVGKPSRTLTWEELLQKNPDIVILMPCGYNLQKTRKEFDRVRGLFPWAELRAFRNHQFYAVDANAYFSRSGPRLVDGLELLAEMLHPEYFTQIAPMRSYIRIS